MDESQVCSTMNADTPEHQPRLFGLLLDLLIYICNFLKLKSVLRLKCTCKYLHATIAQNPSVFYYFHMSDLEAMFSAISDEQTRYQWLRAFDSIKCLETVINFNKLLPSMRQNEEYKSTELFHSIPAPVFYDTFVTKFLSQLHKLETVIVNGCFDDCAMKLPVQPRLQRMTVRNAESSELLASFFNRLVRAQLDDDEDGAASNAVATKSDNSRHIDSWCKIFGKAGNLTLTHLKVYDFIISVKTLFHLSQFENLHSLYMHYETIDYASNAELICQSHPDLQESLDIVQSKYGLLGDLCFVDGNGNKWHTLELFAVLVFKNISCLRELSVVDEHSSSLNGDNTMCLLLLYYALQFHAHNLQSLRVRFCVPQSLPLATGHGYDNVELRQLYYQVMRQRFKFNVDLFKSFHLTLCIPRSQNDEDDEEDEEENDDEDSVMDVDACIMQYGAKTRHTEYTYNLPLPLQLVIALSDAFEHALLDAHGVDSEHYLNDFSMSLERSKRCDVRLGQWYGFMLAKLICAYRPRNMLVLPTLSNLQRADSRFFLTCIEAMAKWSALLVSTCLQTSTLQWIESFKICISCLHEVSVKQLSEFCVGDGQDMRLMHALQILSQQLHVPKITVNIETMMMKDDNDKLRYYMKLQKAAQMIKFKIDLTFKENSQLLVLSSKN